MIRFEKKDLDYTLFQNENHNDNDFITHFTSKKMHIQNICLLQIISLFHRRTPFSPWVNQTGFDSLAIEAQHHATSLVFCSMCFLNKVLSLAVSQPKNSVYSCIFTSCFSLQGLEDQSCLLTINVEAKVDKFFFISTCLIVEESIHLI